MKIDGRSSIANLDQIRSQKKEDAKSVKAGAPKVLVDKIDTKLSQALDGVLKGISETGLSAGEVHGNITPRAVEKLLDQSPVEAVRPRLPEGNLLALADRVAAQMLQNPEKAVAAFGDLNSIRASELL